MRLFSYSNLIWYLTHLGAAAAIYRINYNEPGAWVYVGNTTDNDDSGV